MVRLTLFCPAAFNLHFDLLLCRAMTELQGDYEPAGYLWSIKEICF